MTEAKTVRVAGNKWKTRRFRELAEPEPVRHSEVITNEHAARQAGQSRQFDAGTLQFRLVYVPEFIEVAKTTPVVNATDVEHVIKKYRLAVEVLSESDYLITLVDAYTGEVIRHISLKQDQDTHIIVPGQHYAAVPLDVTVSGPTTYLRDPERYSGETGGLNEGNSDFFGKLIQAHGQAVLGHQPPGFAKIPENDRWVMGDEDLRYPAELKRYMCHPSLDGHSLDMWQPGVMGGLDAHYASGPINRMHCLLVRGILPWLSRGGDPVLQTPLVPNGFTGIGSEKAARIWYKTLSNLARYPMPVFFSNARDASLAAATELYGEYSDPYKAVEDAFAAVFVGMAADRTPPTVTARQVWVAPNTPFVMDVNDESGVASLQVDIDGTTFLPVLQPWQVLIPEQSLSPPGSIHKLNVLATDTNKNSKQYSFDVGLDNAPPVISAFSISDPYHPNGKPMHMVASDDHWLKEASFLFDDHQFLPRLLLFFPYPQGNTHIDIQPTLSIPGGTQDGAYELIAQVKDGTGHTAQKRIPIYWDGTPPTCAFSGLQDVMPTSGNMGVQTSDVTTGVARVDFYIDTTFVNKYLVNIPPGQTYSTSAGYTTTPGTHTFKIICTDKVGLSTPVTQAVTVAAPPTISGSVIGTPTTNGVTWSLTVHAASGIKQIGATLYCSVSLPHNVATPVSGLPMTFDQTFTSTGFVAQETC